ncbi:head GIN domain-containing protein [Sphingobacterium cellulitidis]|uniref:head GIN domain-containing protein n=1 Tax=Sphingobacterium cellulitidis TaxID=1768011 RepID=UPI000B9463C6|nr:hypothetical protein CHT99_06520 [Sphingobacterium cellulitidis]
MKITLSMLMLAFITMAHAQHKESRKIGSFSEISVSAGIQVKFIKSSKNEVLVDVSKQEYLSKIETVVNSRDLQIRVKRGSQINSRTPIKVTVYSNSMVRTISVSSAASLEILDPISVNNFRADLSSSGSLVTGKIEAQSSEINLSSTGKMRGELKTEELQVSASSAGNLTLSGIAKNSEFDLSSNGKGNLENFKTGDLEVNASSGGSLIIGVSNSITANVSSAGKVEYIGNPKTKDINKSSGGSVTQR